MVKNYYNHSERQNLINCALERCQGRLDEALDQRSTILYMTGNDRNHWDDRDISWYIRLKFRTD